ncbi:hypothetical protein SELMODRAFT_168793 [Selaginella moellendorffii]|uniref:branched-chain-amino-acid transaminase n=1 Tax=Selaginella moellendorffii TaxID=88036 RepID=D8R7M9_SELML|nr:branched-chain-amino-acid aminotransferase [Selaginella moellendorffii]EFJ31906.1 hypothetical protein SELMODRAFT_168793 [Selaginella moellendorffii]|eukprot:XP_002967307.1 branched-chain-amino-acid aminotransferase [Selaginella moellendorffii]
MERLPRTKLMRWCWIQARSISSWTSFNSEFKSLPLQQAVASAHEPVELPSSDICFDNLVVNRSGRLKVKPVADANVLKFGAETTDHMLQISWNEQQGWLSPEINPLQHLKLHPCAQVLHYATECFEGMKAYKDKDGRIRLFRPLMHMNRLLKSAQRLALPEFDKMELLDCIKELVRLERDWIPSKEGFSLYIRPAMIATQACLGIQAPREGMLFVVLSPVGPYFPTGLKPVKLFVDRRNVRAYPGGVGDRKLGGNYAQTVLPQLEAAKRGCSQVLYVLEGTERIGEAGSMNIFFLLRDGTKSGAMELVTPALDGTILPGVTRDTVLKLASNIPGLKVSERPLNFPEIEAAVARGDLLEAFGTGTACMIQPVEGMLKENGQLISVPFNLEAANQWISRHDCKTREIPFNLCGYLTRTISDIHYGHVSSEWSVVVN